ncbi:MAG: sigma-70 family RNA polymerase sigma factor [Opitutales bacterium]
MSSEAAALNPAQWVDNYGDALYRYAYLRVNNEALAEDLVQETFLAAMRAKDKFRGGSSAKTWLTGILKNKVIDYYRKKNRSESLQAAAEFYEKEESELFSSDGHWNYQNSNVPADWSPEQVLSADRREFMKHFHACARKLPERIRRVFMMRELDGLSSPEICEQMEISQQNLWTMLHRARMALRDCLQKSFTQTDGSSSGRR